MTVLDFATKTEVQGRTEKVELEALSLATGFPAQFIKEELLLSEDTVDMGSLRELMLNYLQATMGKIEQ